MPSRPPPRRFEATETTSMKLLQATLAQMGATNRRVLRDFDTNAVEISFDRDGVRYFYPCNVYPHYLDNLRAAQLTISGLWQIALYNVGYREGNPLTTKSISAAVAQHFGGLRALPGDKVLALPSGDEWWTVLGVEPTADRETVKNAYRALVRVHHPDAGGNPETFKRITAAYEQGVRERGK